MPNRQVGRLGGSVVPKCDQEKHIMIVKRLLFRLSARREKALIRAAEGGNLDLVRALLEAGTNPNSRCNDGFTALMWAAARGHIEVVQALLDFGADRGARSSRGRTAAEIAIQERQEDIVGYLREDGATYLGR